jgi:hypothetical protein
MGVNHPSVEALRPDHGWGNSCHTQSCRKGKKGSVGKREEEEMRDRDRGREPRGTQEIQGFLNRGEGE